MCVVVVVVGSGDVGGVGVVSICFSRRPDITVLVDWALKK